MNIEVIWKMGSLKDIFAFEPHLFLKSEWFESSRGGARLALKKAKLVRFTYCLVLSVDLMARSVAVEIDVCNGQPVKAQSVAECVKTNGQ